MPIHENTRLAVIESNKRRRGKKRNFTEAQLQRLAESVRKSWENPDDPRRVDHEVRAKMQAGASKAGKAGKGRKATDKTRQTLSEAQKRFYRTERGMERRAEMAITTGEFQRGRPKSEEWCRKHSELHTAQWADPEFRAKTIAALNAAWDSKERRKAVSDRRKEDWNDSEYRERMTILLRELSANNVMTDETRQKISLGISKAIVEGRLKVYPNGMYKSGKHFSDKLQGYVHYRSSYELKAYQLLDADPNVALYITEPCAIPYEYQGQAHRYIPDLYIEFIDGSWSLVEVKPEFQLDDEETQIKHMAAYAKYDEHFTVWCEQELVQ